MNVRYAWFPPGLIEIVCEDNAVISLKRVFQKRYAESDFEGVSACVHALSAYFAGEPSFRMPKLNPVGTPFERAVWAEIEKIPYGQTKTYSDIAQLIGKPTAVRAVGRAVGKNPVWILIPCHRVVGKANRLGGYAGGMEMKQMLLHLETGACPYNV